MTINGSGTITGLSAGGLPDATIQPADLSTGGPYWDTSGNVGIGTSSPATNVKLQVVSPTNTVTNSRGNVYIQTSETAGIDKGAQLTLGGFYTGTSEVPFASIAGRKEVGDSSVSGYLQLGTLNSSGTLLERMRIDSSGSLLVGQTSGNNARFSVFSTGTNLVEARSASTGITHFLVSTTISTAGGSDAFGAYDAGGLAARISTNGYYQSRPNSYGATSDIKLKENVVNTTPKLADLMQVQVRNYNYKDEPEFKQIGVIAQELETVFPALVYETVDRDTEGNDLGTTTKAVKYSVFVPMLIKAIQEQQALITQLQADVAQLKGQA
jgi:hypothetical protein